MLTELGTIIYKDDDRVISVAILPEGTKEYRIEQLKRNCFYCNKSVHKDSGGWLRSDKATKLVLPKFFCRSHYTELKVLLKSIK